MRITKVTQCFYDFCGYSYLDEIDKKKKADENAVFINFFETDVNVFGYVEKQTCNKKQHSYMCSQKAMFVLKLGIIDFPKYQHAVWLKDLEKASECFVCNKCHYRVFHLNQAYNKHYRGCDSKIKDM
jgi:hypothetical protein